MGDVVKLVMNIFLSKLVLELAMRLLLVIREYMTYLQLWIIISLLVADHLGIQFNLLMLIY